MNATHSLIVVMIAASLATVLSVSDAHAIPAFARKYKLGCNACHTLEPQLNRFGRDFSTQRLMSRPISSWRNSNCRAAAP